MDKWWRKTKEAIDKRLKEKSFFIDKKKGKKICDFMIEEMEKGLKGKTSSLGMLPAFIPFADKPLKDQELVVIEQGGMNLRAARCQIIDGVPKLGRIICRQAPGSGKKWEVEEFFESLIEKIKPVLRSNAKIGFVFSYELRSRKNGDGKLLGLAKELNVSGLIGRLVGKNFKKYLLKKGFKDCQILILNDTVATLLSGKLLGKPWESLIGLVVATGTNAAYVERGREIINIESGKLDPHSLGVLTDYDKAVDKKSEIPGDHLYEKMIAGKYTPQVLKEVLRDLIKAGVLGRKIKESSWWQKATSKEMGRIIKAATNKNLKQKYLRETSLDKLIFEAFSYLSKIIFTRSAFLVGAMLAGIFKKMNFGKDLNRPLAVVVEGPLFWQIPGYKEWVDQSLKEILGKRNVEFLKIKNAGLIGAAYAAALRL